MPTDQVVGVSIFNRGTIRTPEAVRVGMGLILLIGLEIEGAIIQPVAAFARSNFVSSILPYDIARVIAIVFILLFGLGGALVVTGRKPFKIRLSDRTLFGFVLWVAVTLYGLFVLPFLLPLEAESVPGNVVFALDGMVETVVAVTGVALLTYNLQSRNGKILLWLASAVGIGVALAFDSQSLHIFPYYATLIQRTILALGGLSSALFAAAFFAAWRRIRSDLVTYSPAVYDRSRIT